MAISPEDITAAPEGTVKPTPAAEPSEKPDAKEGDTTGGLPDELLEKAPALGLLMEGAPPATYAAKDAEYPELKVVEKHIKELGKAGFGVYGTKDGNNVVLFNGLLITPEEIAAADEAGTLDQVATPYDQLRAEFGGADSQSGGGAPASADVPGLPAGVAVSGASGGQPAGAQKATANARAKAIQPGAPSSGPSPGAGRILNNIVKPVI